MILDNINLEWIFQEFNADQKTRTFTTFVGKGFGAAQTRNIEFWEQYPSTLRGKCSLRFIA